MTASTVIFGLTGSIGMGKSTAAKALERPGLRVFSADHVVHDLMGPNGAAVAAVKHAFPDARDGKSISRQKLAANVLGDPEALNRLEGILHPLVRNAEIDFIRAANLSRQRAAALDVPLLFETGADRLCHYTIVVTAPSFVQNSRVLRRAGMTRARLAAILDRQMPDAEKRRRADFVVQTGLDRRHAFRSLKAIVETFS
jgi:dephospho-CoA kinase